MSDPRRERRGDEGIGEATEAWLERIRETYGPAPLGAARRAALERECLRRREAPRWRVRWAAPVVAAAAAAAATALWLRLPAAAPPVLPAPAPVAQPVAAADAQAASNWAAQLFDPPELGEASTSQDTNLYPADLAAIDVAFLQP